MIQTRAILKTIAISKWIVSGAFLTFVLALMLFKSSLLTPTVTIQTANFPAKQSQLFFKNGSDYTERNSVTSKLDPDSKKLEFKIRRYDNNLRWDPLEGPGSFYVTSVNIGVLGYTKTVPLNDLTSTIQVKKVDQNQNQAHFVVPDGSTDPQVNISISKKSLDRVRVVIALLLGFVSAIMILGWIKWHEKILNFMQEEHTYTKKIKVILKREHFSLSEYVTLLGIGVFLNIIPVVNLFLSVDDEIGAFRTDASVWVADGRWTAFLIEKFIFPQPILPFVPNLFFYACLALAYMFIIRAHQIKFYWVTALAYCVFVAHPIWWFIGEFYSNVPSIGFGVLTLSIAIFIFSKYKSIETKTNTAKIIFSTGLLLALSIGAYQSLIMFYIATGISIILLKLRKENTTNEFLLRPTLRRIFLLIGSIASGLLIYAIINKLARNAYPSDRDYIDGFLRINELLADPLLITKLVLVEMWKFYTGSHDTYGASFFSSFLILAVAFLILITHKSWKISLCMGLLVASMLISPFLLNFVTGGLYLPLRAMLAVSFIFWIATLTILERKGLIRFAGTIAVTAMLFQMLSANGQYAASTMMATQHDRFTAEALYSRISQENPKFNRNEDVLIDVYGRLPFETIYPSPNTSTMSSSFFDWDYGNVYRMMKYMKLIGFTNVNPLGNAARIPLTPQFETMSVWPAAGSVRYKDGIYFVKLSETPDPTHALYKKAESDE